MIDGQGAFDQVRGVGVRDRNDGLRCPTHLLEGVNVDSRYTGGSVKTDTGYLKIVFMMGKIPMLYLKGQMQSIFSRKPT